MGSTGLLVLLDSTTAYVCNVGDTRAVGCKAGSAVQLSYDHRPLTAEARARITEGGGFVSETGRVNGILGVERAFGDFFLSPYVQERVFFKIVFEK